MVTRTLLNDAPSTQSLLLLQHYNLLLHYIYCYCQLLLFMEPAKNRQC